MGNLQDTVALLCGVNDGNQGASIAFLGRSFQDFLENGPQA